MLVREGPTGAVSRSKRRGQDADRKNAEGLVPERRYAVIGKDRMLSARMRYSTAGAVSLERR
jgi:hypothetical protein